MGFSFDKVQLWQSVLIESFSGVQFGDELESSRQASVVSLQACMSFFWV